MNTLSRLSLILVALLLGACAERTPDDTGTDPATGAGSSPNGDTVVSDPTTDDEGNGPFFTTDPSDSVDPNGEADGPGDEPTSDPSFAPDIDSPDPIDDGAAPAPDPIFAPDTASPDPAVDAEGEPAPDPVPVDPTPGSPEDAPDADPPPDGVSAAPEFPGRPDAARLHAALTRIVGVTLLDLNARLAGGIELTDQQIDCLGEYNPALGESLLGIDCARALATEPLVVYIERGAFAPTDTCRASVAGGTIDGCVLVVADAVVPTDFVQTPPARRPAPVAGSGVVIAHDVELGVFEVSREPDAPVGDFRCGIDIVTGTTLATNSGDCDAVFRDAADFAESLLAPT